MRLPKIQNPENETGGEDFAIAIFHSGHPSGRLRLPTGFPTWKTAKHPPKSALVRNCRRCSILIVVVNHL